MSDREQSGVRGAVRQCVEETIFPEVCVADGTQIPERKHWYATEYDINGRLLTTSYRGGDGSEFATRYIYDPAGRLLKTVSAPDGQSTTEMVYSYDAQGRLLSITDNRAPDNPVVFQYDERGRKTKVQVSSPADYRPNTAIAGPPFEAADRAPNLQGGGTATTVYDEHDRAAEVVVRDSQGEVVTRAVRTYDAKGRISEERAIVDNPETIFPPEIRQKILKESGVTREELGAQLKKLMGGRYGPHSVAYSYDEQDRITHTHRRIFNQEHNIEITYNEHGDTAAEITRGTQSDGGSSDSTPTPELCAYSEVFHSYQYDAQGNWTEEIVTSRSSPDGPFAAPTTRRRTLTYY